MTTTLVYIGWASCLKRDADGLDTDEVLTGLLGRGCGCCTSFQPITAESLDDAILETEQFLQELKEQRVLI